MVRATGGVAPTSEFIERLRHTPLREFVPHVWYPGYMPGLPDLLLLRLPPELQHPGEGQPITLAHKICIVEDEGNRRVVEDSLAKPIPFEAGVINWRLSLDRVMARRSSRPRGDMAVLMYAPPEEGWPWLIVTALPFNAPGEGFARERYAWEAFADEAGAQAHMLKLRQMHPPGVEAPIVYPDRSKTS